MPEHSTPEQGSKNAAVHPPQAAVGSNSAPDPHGSAADAHQIDPSKIILPQKPSGPSVLSASRAPAAEVLTAANYIKTHVGEAPHAPERLPDIPATAANALPDVPALHTYKGDVATTIENQNISLATIVQRQAEADRTNVPTQPTPSAWQRIGGFRLVEILVGIVLIAAAAGALGWTYLRLRPLIPSTSVTAPILYVDQKKSIPVAGDETRDAFLASLVDAKGDQLSVGLIEQLALPVASTSGTTAPLTTRGFFSTVAPQGPDSLVRALQPQFLLGLYSADGDQPFLIFKTDEYAQAFAGMLDWEYTMESDLDPLFPKPTDTGSPIVATSASSTASTTPPSAPSTGVLNTPFSDAILNNHDTRVVRDQQGNVVLLWSFIDRQTLVITTNAATLGEVTSRLQKAPTIIVPN